MKELKFRALSNNAWVYRFLSANLSIEPNIYFINTGFSEDPTYVVEKSTIGKFTALTDKNGKEIYTGDKLRTKYGNIIEVKDLEYIYLWRYENHNAWSSIEVIGNIHQSKELIKN